MKSNVITRDVDILGGTPVFRGTRVPFQALIDYLKAGHSIEVFLEDFPTVQREQVLDVLELTSEMVTAGIDEDSD